MWPGMAAVSSASKTGYNIEGIIEGNRAGEALTHGQTNCLILGVDCGIAKRGGGGGGGGGGFI